MGKSKKKFIDKKNASTYHLLHRSQRDIGGEGDGGMVLWPSPDNRKETDEHVLPSMEKIKEQVASLVDDYDYEQHMKPIKGSGTFLDAQGNRNALLDPRARVLEDDVQEVSRELEAIALTPDCMDDDVAQALFGDFEEGEFEEILDDFCLTAAQDPGEDEEEEFDYDAHIRSLMERAAMRESDSGGIPVHKHSWGKNDHKFFSIAKPLHHRDDEDDDVYSEALEAPGIVPALNPEEERALCEKFEQTLAEYDSDEVGDLDEDCEDIRGDRPLEGDAQVDAALDEFLEEKKDEIFMEGTRHLPEYRQTGGSGFAALVGKNLVSAADLGGDDDLAVHDEPTPVEEILKGADQILANPEMEPPAEEILIDGKSYFSERTRNPWDCESILSTYSNLDNNPVTIESRRRRKKRSNKQQISPETLPEDEPLQIRLSNKTGLPIGVLPSRTDGYLEDDTFVSVNRGVARKIDETPEEKKARKQAVKQEREMARMRKKLMKEAFQDEFTKRSGDLVADDVGGKSVFRYS
jgi:protein LTV1